MSAPTTGPRELRGLALRTLLPGFAGTDVPPSRLLELIDEGIGGVVLFGRNVDADRADAGVAALTARLRAARPDLIVAIDEEGGDVTRLDVATGSAYPGSAALGAADDPELTRDVAAELAARLRACGITVNFAPVADVDADPRNPVIGVRAFGADPELVGRHSAAFVAGQQARGVAATVKHFPGHGGTAEDSHVTVPVLDVPLDVLERRELVPFGAALAAGARIVMTAHILVPALDPDNLATLSPAVITGLLRERLGFDGLVMTDGLDMRAISGTIGHAEGAVRSLIAGVDAICIGGDSVHLELVDEMAGAIVAAVRSGRLGYERLVEAAGRVEVLARWTGAVAVPNGQVEAVPAGVRAARRAVTAHGVVALPGPPLVLELQDEPSLAAGRVPWGVGGPLAARMPGTVVVPVHETGPSLPAVLARHAGHPVVVAVRGVRRRPWQLAAVAAVRELRPDAVVVDHELSEPGQFAEPYVLAYGAARVTAEAAADLLVTALPFPVDHATMGRHADLSSSTEAESAAPQNPANPT
jgi:beta-N-acetylhexosaminidase